MDVGNRGSGFRWQVGGETFLRIPSVYSAAGFLAECLDSRFPAPDSNSESIPLPSLKHVGFQTKGVVVSTSQPKWGGVRGLLGTG